MASGETAVETYHIGVIIMMDCHGNQMPYLSHICFRTILKPTAFHIGRKRALDAQAAAFVYIYARIPQIAEIHTSFYATWTEQASAGVVVRLANLHNLALLKLIQLQCKEREI
jgi:hypothetical protein